MWRETEYTVYMTSQTHPTAASAQVSITGKTSRTELPKTGALVTKNSLRSFKTCRGGHDTKVDHFKKCERGSCNSLAASRLTIFSKSFFSVF